VAGASIAEVALAHGVNANQLHSWRRLHRRGLLSSSESAALLPVRVVRGEGSIPVVHLDANSAARYQASRPRRTRSAGLIQIELERGRLRVEGTPDPATLRMVLECLLA
jgi:transposase